MDGYQSIVNMQLLAIEKTLLAVDQYLHTDYSSEIADLVTNLGMSIHNLLNKMQKATKRGLLSHINDKKHKSHYRTTNTNKSSFSHGISTRSTRVDMGKQIQEYACTKLSHSMASILREKQREYFEHWKTHWLVHGSQSSAIISTEKSPRVRFSDGNSDLSRKPSFMDAESSGKKNAVQRLIARHNGTSDDHDNPSTQPSHMGHEYGDKLNHDTHASTLHTPQPTPHSHYDDMDASYSFSPSPEVEESDGEVGGEDSAYSPALFSAHDGAPLLLDSIEDMYIGQGGPATYATITTTGSLVNLPDSDSPSVLAHTPAHEPVHIHTHTHTPHLTHTDSAAAAHKRDRYTLPFSMDSMDDLYMQIVEMDNRNTHTHTQSRTHTSNRARGHAHVPMSPSRCLLTNMLSSFQPTQHEGQEAPIFIVPQLAANTSEMSVDSGMITHNHTSTSVTHDNPSVKLTQTSIRSTSNTPKSARYPSKMSEQSHFTNFSPGGHVDGMEEAFELSP